MRPKTEYFIRGTIAFVIVLCLGSSYGNGKEYKSIVDWLFDSQTFRALFKIALLVFAIYLAWGGLRTQNKRIN